MQWGELRMLKMGGVRGGVPQVRGAHPQCTPPHLERPRGGGFYKKHASASGGYVFLNRGCWSWRPLGLAMADSHGPGSRTAAHGTPCVAPRLQYRGPPVLLPPPAILPSPSNGFMIMLRTRSLASSTKPPTCLWFCGVIAARLGSGGRRLDLPWT